MTEKELQLLEARWRVREITESDLHSVANDLLDNGEESDALINLFSLDRDALRWTGAAAFESLLRAWGGGTMSEKVAVRIVLRALATGVAAETVTPLRRRAARTRSTRARDTSTACSASGATLTRSSDISIVPGRAIWADIRH